ncbi:MAG: AMP-binding protein [Ilumatobacteraceae bacterium]|nr:AMP-binding protein [Ilumatobacteraceae bacterium]
MEMHFASVWESIADVVPDQPAVTHGNLTRSWAEYDERAARLAAALCAAGLGHDSKTALYMYNSNEFMESEFASMKTRGVPVNVNYRYLDEELRYLLDNSDAEALIFHSSLGDRVARVVDQLPKLKLLIEVDDGDAGQVPGALAFEEVLATSEPMERITRSEDDMYMLYTGGTTGMPKGVMYSMGAMTGGFVSMVFPILGLPLPEDASEIPGLVKQVYEADELLVSIPAAPLMHGTGAWLGWFIPHLTGGEVVTMTSRRLDAHELLRSVEDRKVTNVIIVGDSFARPIVRALNEEKPDGSSYDTSSIKMFMSSGVMWTSEVKQQMIDKMEQVMLIDAMGSTEGGMANQMTMKGIDSETAKFEISPTTKVFADDDSEIVPGSNKIGMVASGSNVPLGYYKDKARSERTFRTIAGHRYSFPGDFAKVAADGTLILLGRGNQVINSGGEKVFPEEVEESVKRVGGVLDCLVVGVPDEKFGTAVTAVVSLNEGAEVSEATIITAVKGDLAGYKAPKTVVFVAEVPRAPNGKADYRTAQSHAESTTSS